MMIGTGSVRRGVGRESGGMNPKLTLLKKWRALAGAPAHGTQIRFPQTAPRSRENQIKNQMDEYIDQVPQATNHPDKDLFC